MVKREKLLKKLADANGTFPWSDLETLLAQLGFEKKEMEGSRVRFYHPQTQRMMRLHKPHPENTIKGGALKAVRDTLKQEGYL